PLEAPRPSLRERRARFRRRLGRRLRLRLRRDPLADPLRRDARLQAVRLVPDRLRNRRTAHRLLRLGGLEGVTQPCVHGRPALRQPPILPRCPSASLSPSNPSRMLLASFQPARVAASAAPCERAPERQRNITGSSLPTVAASSPRNSGLGRLPG